MSLFLTPLLLTLFTSPPTEILWQIGRPGDGSRELAIAGDYRAYAARFPQDATYVVGRSSPERDWPYVQPGPDDTWAGQRAHTFQIRFPLGSPPHYACRLVLDLANTHYGSAPRLDIRVNGGRRYAFPLPEGTDDRSLSDPSLGKRSAVSLAIPPQQMRAGDNEIAITNAGGSWLIYDAVRLETGPSAPQDRLSTSCAQSPRSSSNAQQGSCARQFT
jgi:hypothetical protein